jgi:hypothetical protein
VYSVQFSGGKSFAEQTRPSGHMAPGQTGPPQTHWVNVVPTQSAYEIAVQPGQLSMATKFPVAQATGFHPAGGFHGLAPYVIG